MAFKKLSVEEQRIVLACMKATAAHIEDWEKHSRLGLEPSELKQVIAKWPNIDDSDKNGSGFRAINNCLNEVCHGFRISPEDWSKWFDTPTAVVEATYQKWLNFKGLSGGIR